MTALVCTEAGGRGCPCDFHARRRVYARNYAARQRRQAMDAKRMSANTCPRRFGRHGTCRAALVSDVIGGHLVVSCPACERMARGICRDCNAPVDGPVGRTRRCAVHRAVANASSMAKYRTLNRREVNDSARRHARKPAVRKMRAEYKRAWRKANRDKVKAQKRRANLRGYGQAVQAKRRGLGIVAKPVHRSHRTCITPRCPIMLTGRKKKCARCKEREAQQAAAWLASRQERAA